MRPPGRFWVIAFGTNSRIALSVVPSARAASEIVLASPLRTRLRAPKHFTCSSCCRKVNRWLLRVDFVRVVLFLLFDLFFRVFKVLASSFVSRLRWPQSQG